MLKLGKIFLICSLILASSPFILHAADVARNGDLNVRIVDPESQTPVQIDSTGRLLVSQEFSVPDNTTAVIRVAQTSTNGSVDTIYTITNGKTLSLVGIQAGSGADQTGGSKVELFEDPNGDLSVLNLITVLYTNGDSASDSLTEQYTGNGTRRIVMRRSAFAGASREIFGRWVGFES